MKNKMEFSRHGLIRSRFGSGGLGFVRLGPEEETDDIFMVVQNEQRDEEDSSNAQQGGALEDFLDFGKKFMYGTKENQEPIIREIKPNPDSTIGNSIEKTGEVLDIIDKIPMPRSFSSKYRGLLRTINDSFLKNRRRENEELLRIEKEMKNEE